MWCHGGVEEAALLDFEDFVRREFPGLARFARAVTGDRQLAEDVLSDALFKVSLRWRRVSALASPAAYTRRVIVRTFLSENRRGYARRERPVPEPAVPDAAVGDPSDAAITRERVRNLLDQLTPHQRMAVVMRYVLDAPDEEIAEAMGCSAATVRSHLSHARQVLRLSESAENEQSKQIDREGERR